MPETSSDQRAQAQAHLSVFDGKNKLKLGTFATNASYGASISEAPTSFHVSWEHTVGLARQAEALGLDMLVPVGRWRGFGGPTNFNGESFETYTWAAGIAQATERVMIFATSHVPTIHPIVAAKQAATIDHISNGRFGVNLVMGWFKPEMEMFGSALREHDERYNVGDEWVQIVKRLWTEHEPFSFDGKFYTINEAQSWPKPIRQPHPVIMNAGSSPAGSDFAARNADINFVSVDDAEVAAKLVGDLKTKAYQKYQREPAVFSGAYVVCRDTEKEAHAAVQSVLDHGDREAAGNLMKILGVQSESFDHIVSKGLVDRFITGWGAPVFAGTPEQIVDQFIALNNAGISGITMGFLDYQQELTHFGDTVLPLLQQAGLRA